MLLLGAYEWRMWLDLEAEWAVASKYSRHDRREFPETTSNRIVSLNDRGGTRLAISRDPLLVYVNDGQLHYRYRSHTRSKSIKNVIIKGNNSLVVKEKMIEEAIWDCQTNAVGTMVIFDS